ncbi:hypothetical protein [Microvirga makkahensis]|uniref:Uncharacterized protein n=1 Tax=Microvirga makkahensis TaxID=1128670 RepID=A0A7X3MP13_9HYPH|nr:hypothetical protein [Microvirga makkahensis]MXQ10423.1 hypothetical protein [Microvirga makkahensis]
MREITVEAVLDDAFDGAVRLLGDAQRFGFELKNLELAAGAEGLVSATLILRVPISVDARLVAARLARHPTVRHVDAAASALLDREPSMVA